MHDYTEGEIPVNHLLQQYVMLKNAIREMGGYEGPTRKSIKNPPSNAGPTAEV